MTCEYLGSSFILVFCTVFCSLLCAYGQLQEESYSIEVSAVTVDSSTGLVAVELVISDSAQENATRNSSIEAVVTDHNGGVRNISAAQFRMTVREDGRSELTLEGLQQDENFTIELQLIREGGSTSLTDPFNLLTTGVQNITAEVGLGYTAVTCHFLEGARADGCLVQWRPLDTEGEGLQNGSLLISRSNGSIMARGVVRSLTGNNSYVVQAFSTRGGTTLHEFGIPLQELLTTEGRPAAPSTEPPTIGSAMLSTSAIVAITLSLFFATLIVSTVIILAILGVMRAKQDSKLDGIRMRLRRRRRKQSNVRGTNSDDIATETNVCYDSSFNELTNPDCDEEFHMYDDIVNCRVPGPGEETPLYENTNLGEMQIPSAQNAEVPHEYEIPVQINSVYHLRDTPNEYEN